MKSRGALDDEPLLEKLIPFLAPNGIFIWEHFAERRVQIALRWEVIRHRTYGETGLTFLRFLHKK